MADTDRLPSTWATNFINASSASNAVVQMMRLYDPAWETLYTHFLGDLIPDEWAAAKTNGTSAAVSVASSQLTLTSGTDDNGYAGQGFGLFWKGDNGIFMASEQALDTLTTSKIEIGLSDATDDAGAVAVKATPTGTADDFGVFVRDTDDNTQLDLISELDNGGPSADAEDVYTVVGGTSFTTEFRVQNDAFHASLAVGLGRPSGVGGGAFQGGDLMTPWWFVQSRAGSASRVLTVEWVACLGPRA